MNGSLCHRVRRRGMSEMSRLTIRRVKREKFGYCPCQLTAGEYFRFFIVTDTILGLQEKVDFFVLLRTTVSKGWMILCEERRGPFGLDHEFDGG